MRENRYTVEVSLDDIATPGAPHAFGPVTLTFTVEGTCLEDAMKNAKHAVREISKLRGTIEKIELR